MQKDDFMDILKDLKLLCEVREIVDATIDARIEKLEEEGAEFYMALLGGNLDEIADEGADVIFVTMITLMQNNINPFAAMLQKLDKMDRQYKFRIK